MPRLITVNAVQITKWGTSDDGTTEEAVYLVGSTDGTTFTSIPGCNTLTDAAYLLLNSDTKVDVITALIGVIFRQEGLTVGTDHVFRPNGTLIQ